MENKTDEELRELCGEYLSFRFNDTSFSGHLEERSAGEFAAEEYRDTFCSEDVTYISKTAIYVNKNLL